MKKACGCPEYHLLSRRNFLIRSTAAVAGLAGAPLWLPRVAFAQDFTGDRDILIAIYLRGGCDGLSLCPPHQEQAYYDARPTLAIPRPDSGGAHAALDLDGFFGLPPSMAALMPAYAAGDFLIAHACGSKDESRSHFDAQYFMEIGKPRAPELATGWLGRHLLSVPPFSPETIIRAISFSPALQQMLVGGPQALPVPDPSDFTLYGDESTADARLTLLQEMYASTSEPLQAAAANTAATVALLDAIDFENYAPGHGAVYPDSDFGRAMKSTAAMIRADLGAEVFAIDVGGWDTHEDQGAVDGHMAGIMGDLADGLAAIHADLIGPRDRNVSVVIMSEFGRNLVENSSRGTDHGHGNIMLFLGNHIAGGRVLTEWPGLELEQLFEEQDLQVTIDYRDLVAELLQKRLGNSELGLVFPDFVPNFRGIVASG